MVLKSYKWSEFTLPKDALCQVWLKLVQRRSSKFINAFHNVTIIFPWKRIWPFIGTKLISLYPKFLQYANIRLVELAKWFWSIRSLNVINAFLPWCNYLPLEKERPFILKNKNSSLKNRRICTNGKFINAFSLCQYYLIPWKREWSIILTSLKDA